jgi:hypothetical protein
MKDAPSCMHVWDKAPVRILESSLQHGRLLLHTHAAGVCWLSGASDPWQLSSAKQLVNNSCVSGMFDMTTSPAMTR